MVVKINGNSLESIHSCIVIMCCQTLLYRGIIAVLTWKGLRLLIDWWEMWNFPTSNDWYKSYSVQSFFINDVAKTVNTFALA